MRYMRAALATPDKGLHVAAWLLILITRRRPRAKTPRVMHVYGSPAARACSTLITYNTMLTCALAYKRAWGALEHAVVRLARRVEDAVRQVLAPDQDAVQVTLGAAVGDVAPVLVLVDVPQPRKPLQHADLRARSPVMGYQMAMSSTSGQSDDSLSGAWHRYVREAQQ